jgi:cytochrome c-type biogenesis protein CcsB
MGVMYWAFFKSSIVLAALATLAYFLYTYQTYRAANAAKSARKRGHKRAPGHVAATPALVTQGAGVQPFSRLLRLVSGYVSSQSAQIASVAQRVRGGQTAVAASDRDFEVADPTLPVTEQAQAFGRLGTILIYLMTFTLFMSLLFRTLITGHPPWTNMYEASIALTEFLSLAYLFFETRYHTRALGVVTSAASLLLLLFAVWVGQAFNQASPLAFGQITPALQDNPILTIHVSMMIVSYAFFIVGFACGVIMLVQGSGVKARFAWLPTAEAADELGYRAITIGFPLLALGIILGAWWANYAWGHYWSWDPKETSALITWLVYAAYMHMRGLRGMRGNAMAWMLIIGFAATLFTYFGVSFLVPGLHSYAGVK